MKPMVTAIDPGTEKSAVLQFNGETIWGAEIVPNCELLDRVRGNRYLNLVIEMIASYGMPVGRETFETVLFIGRLMEAQRAHWPGEQGQTRLAYRKDIKMYLCQSMRAKDGNVRQALIDKHGAPGTKANPGKTYGISSHLWSALAIADYAINNPEPKP